MAAPYSSDLRERVVEAVELEGLSRQQAASRFKPPLIDDLPAQA